MSEEVGQSVCKQAHVANKQMSSSEGSWRQGGRPLRRMWALGLGVVAHHRVREGVVRHHGHHGHHGLSHGGAKALGRDVGQTVRLGMRWGGRVGAGLMLLLQSVLHDYAVVWVLAVRLR